MYSYQAASIEMVQKNSEVLELNPSGVDVDMGIFGEVRALINPDKLFDKEKGFGAVVRNVIIMFALLSICSGFGLMRAYKYNDTSGL